MHITDAQLIAEFDRITVHSCDSHKPVGQQIHPDDAKLLRELIREAHRRDLDLNGSR